MPGALRPTATQVRVLVRLGAPEWRTGCAAASKAAAISRHESPSCAFFPKEPSISLPSPAGEKMVPVSQRGALDRSDCGHSPSVSATGRQICCREEPLKTEARLWEVTTDHPWAVVVDSENSEPAGGAGCSTCALVARCSSVTDVVRLAGAVGGPWEPRGMPKRRLSTRAPTDGGTRRGDPLDAIGRCERRSHLKRRTPPIHTPQAPEYGRISPLVRRLY